MVSLIFNIWAFSVIILIIKPIITTCCVKLIAVVWPHILQLLHDSIVSVCVSVVPLFIFIWPKNTNLKSFLCQHITEILQLQQCKALLCVTFLCNFLLRWTSTIPPNITKHFISFVECSWWSGQKCSFLHLFSF